MITFFYYSFGNSLIVFLLFISRLMYRLCNRPQFLIKTCKLDCKFSPMSSLSFGNVLLRIAFAFVMHSLNFLQLVFIWFHIPLLIDLIFYLSILASLWKSNVSRLPLYKSFNHITCQLFFRLATLLIKYLFLLQYFILGPAMRAIFIRD